MTSPNPNWKPGQKIASPVEKMIEIDPARLETKEMYKLLIGCIVPRPIAFVSTLDSQGRVNLAPFSFFNGVSSNPPCVAVSVSRKPTGEKKDTLINIEETKQFVVNSANDWLIEPLVHCGAAYPYGVSELTEVGLTALASIKVKPPRIKESTIHMECELYKLVAIGEGGPGSSTLIIGKIILMHIYSQAYSNGKILLEQLKPVARLGGYSYAHIGDLYNIPVPEI